MAAPTINFAGFVYDDTGTAVNGATIHIYDKNTTTTAREASSVTSNSSGYWSYSHATPGEFDVEIVRGTSKRRFKFDDKIHLAEIDVEKLSIRGNEGALAGLYLYADEGDDASDQWLIDAGTDGVLAFGNDIASQGTFADHMTITPNATVTSSTVAVLGNLSVATALVPDAADGAALGTTALEWSDLYLADSSVIYFGADQDTTITHTDGSGITLNSTNKLMFNDASQFVQGSSATVLSIGATDEIDLTATAVDLNGTLNVSGNAQFSGTVTVGVDDTGLDVKFFGASAGAYLEWDESADTLRIMGASADATTSTGKLLLATSLTDINANDVLGKIDFQAPHEAGGTDAITVAASIQAIAQGTFSASVNATDLIFYTGHSEAATEKFRITSQGELGVGGANYGTDGQVLTSGGAGAAPAWESNPTAAVTALNSATENELVTVASTTTELDAEASLLFDGALKVGASAGSGVDAFLYTAGTAAHVGIQWDADLATEGTLVGGADDHGVDLKFFGETSGNYMQWDMSTDDLILAGSSRLHLYDAGGGEYLLSDGTDLTIASGAKINLTATSDVHVPANVGVVFGTGEKIEGDDTDLTITSGAKINLTATSDVHIPTNVGVVFGTGEKIEGDDTDLTLTSGGDIVLNATANVGIGNTNPGYPLTINDGDGGWTFVITQSTSGSSPGGIKLDWSASAPNNTSTEAINFQDSSAVRFIVYGNGNVVNAGNSYGSTSDVALKQDISDARDYTNDFKNVRFRKFRMKTDVAADSNAPYRLGVIAQEVDDVFPSLVDDGSMDGTTAKTFKYSVLNVIAMKVLQSLIARVEALES